MFGFRADGKRVKGLDPIQKIMPHIMKARHDSQNLFKYPCRCEPLDAFIASQKELGVPYKPYVPKTPNESEESGD